MAHKIFISYRRDSAKYQARQIYAALCDVLPQGHVFMDIDSIPLGQDFRSTLKGWVEECDVMLALIGPGWADVTEAGTNRRRLDSSSDFVRIEVAAALSRGIPVVPLMLDRAEMPDPESLPADLRGLVDRQAEFIEFRTFDHDVERLISKLGLTPDTERPEAPGREVRRAPGISSSPANDARPEPMGGAKTRSATVQPVDNEPATVAEPLRPRALDATSPASSTPPGPALQTAARFGRPPDASPTPTTGDTNGANIAIAAAIGCLALPVTYATTSAFHAARLDLLGSPYNGGDTGGLLTTLFFVGLFGFQLSRGLSGTALAFYWLAIVPCSLWTTLLLANAFSWGGRGNNSLVGALVGAAVIAVCAVPVFYRARRSRSSLAVIAVGLGCTIATVITTIFVRSV